MHCDTLPAMQKRLMLTVTFSLSAAFAAEVSIKQADLPAAVRNALPAQTNGAEIKNILKETVKGKTVYEVETVAKGMTRDLILSSTGALLETEEQVTLESIPAASRKALEAKARGAKIEKVEALTKGGRVSYEAAIDRNGKKSEISAR
jgi:uncharacterized membrane protein YkoI